MAHRDINDAGIALIQHFEGLPDGRPATINFDPYLDPVGMWTVGWGHVIYINGRRLEGEKDREAAISAYPDGLTKSEAEALLRADLIKTVAQVQGLVKVPLTDNEFAALVSFTFNVGATNLAKSTLLKELNAENRFAAAEQFGRWILAKGVRMNGLIRRRKAERDLFIDDI